MTAAEITLDNGDQYIIDPTGRTIAPVVPDPLRDLLAKLASDTMGSGQPVGPQADEYVGLVGDWDSPRADTAAFFALWDIVSMVGRSIARFRPV